MKITVDLEDFWLDEEMSLEEGLKSHVTHVVKNSIWKSIEGQVEEKITKKVSSIITTKLEERYDAIITQLLEKEKIKSPNSSISDENGMCTLEDKLKYDFVNNTGWTSPLNKLEALSKKFGKEMKDRFDLMFASQIVIKLNEQGLLKEGVADSILDKK